MLDVSDFYSKETNLHHSFSIIQLKTYNRMQVWSNHAKKAITQKYTLIRNGK
jgi:hypothetical protein